MKPDGGHGCPHHSVRTAKVEAELILRRLLAGDRVATAQVGDQRDVTPPGGDAFFPGQGERHRWHLRPLQHLCGITAVENSPARLEAGLTSLIPHPE
eukprot:CAMPEP_0181183054 /NCGR_PEP_ID=MMETSP1096-20121128/8218_1 /TAXON_ID=156174 ORGANISM="Chrysochromulina ericina, Strain CCMP281" /NCGR_SAMPLE_ID=MMETSP1096 /ASSEMBLY_ACC=CAM_ASM_000453 /LENGTH=96 /DNA_ID=CAMNT_0023271703 /DNA_START=570 /DNA_END=860 /DNA_ORIENTATION=-